MASTVASKETAPAPRSLSGRWSVAVPFSFVAALVVNAVLTFMDTARFRTESELNTLTFGSPLGWLTQDQSALDPPFPGSATLSSPLEHPVAVALVPLVLNIALVMVVLLAAWAAIRALRTR
jgi:hypothetical protein